MERILKNVVPNAKRTVKMMSVFLLLTTPTAAFANNEEGQNTIRLWIADTATETGINDWLTTDFRAIHPNVRIEAHIAGALEVLDQARKGNADVVITHVPASEKLFLAQGYGTRRATFMYNEFLILGPKSAGSLVSEPDIRLVMKQLAKDEVAFQAPSPRSGTSAKLTELWSMSGVQPSWVGYVSTGESAVATLRNAATFGAYTFVDMGTYLAHRGEIGDRLVPIYRDNIALRNFYSVIVISRAKIPNARQDLADEFMDYLISDRGQERIGHFDKYGASLFMPAAAMDEELRAARAEVALRAKNRIINVMAGLIVTLLVVIGILKMKPKRGER